jgi:hypothetical protein
LSKIEFWLFIFFSIGFFFPSLFATFFYLLGTSLFPLSASCCYFFFVIFVCFSRFLFLWWILDSLIHRILG